MRTLAGATARAHGTLPASTGKVSSSASLCCSHFEKEHGKEHALLLPSFNPLAHTLSHEV